MLLPPTPKVSFAKLLLQTFLVFVVFMLVDLIFHMVVSSGEPYDQDIAMKIVWTLLLAVTFSHLFNLTAQTWIVNNKEGMPYFKPNTILLGAVFGLLIGIAFIAIIGLSQYMATTVYVFLLDGIRGVPPPDGESGAMIVTSTTVSGMVLAHSGKEESPVQR